MNTQDHYEKAKLFFNEGIINLQKKNYLEAERFFIDSLIELPNRISTLINLSGVQIKLQKYEKSLLNSHKSIELEPMNMEALLNFGLSNYFLNNYKVAILSFEKILKIDSNKIEALINISKTYEKIHKYDLAIEYYKKAFKINKFYNFLYCYYITLKTKICLWDNLDNEIKDFNELVKLKKIVSLPFSLLATSDDPSIHSIGTKKFIEVTYANSNIKYSSEMINISDKINIGYFSSDFRNHAVSHLIKDLFKNHDKSIFNIYGFNYNPYADDDMTKALGQHFENFEDIRDKNEIEVREICTKLNIHIAVDLNGFTEHGRTPMFINRLAPIQINFLGYPGSMNLNCYDYIIADNVLITDKIEDYFDEKIVYMPKSYQINSLKNNVKFNNKLKREDFNLSNNSIVFCCFNRNYKILPNIFKIWMKILNQVEDSVLWIFEDNKIASENLIKEAKKNGISRNRIIFAKAISHKEHLERQKLADIFLDTFPYNAHTTCIDAIWAGLPVITLKGNSFSSRVASSILSSLNLNELITNSLIEYEAKAIEIANNKKKLTDIKNYLSKEILTNDLFNSTFYTQNIEKAYQIMIEFYKNKKISNIII